MVKDKMVEMQIGEVSSKGKIEKHQQVTSTQSEKFRHGRTMVTLERVQISLSKPTQLSASKLKSHQIRMISADPFQKPNSIKKVCRGIKSKCRGSCASYCKHRARPFRKWSLPIAWRLYDLFLELSQTLRYLDTFSRNEHLWLPNLPITLVT